ncbi:MAG: bifunctional DNA primase/polymerase [Alphaproteobacteria bacterium]
MTNILFNEALKLVEQGARIFPLQPKGKKPLTAHGHKDAANDPAQINEWWKKWPDANIGIATGARSGVWVLDIDGHEGEASLRALEQKYGELPPTVEAISGGGGRHLYFKWTNCLNFSISASRVGEKIDIRGEGGYIVAPPSIHPNGKRYEWSVDSADDFEKAPEWLTNLARGTTNNQRAPTNWNELLQGVSEGSRNDSISRITGKLLGHKIEPRMALMLVAAWNDSRCTPPLPNDELFRTFESIAIAEAKKRGLV